MSVALAARMRQRKLRVMEMPSSTVEYAQEKNDGLKQLRLVKFRAFSDFTVTFKGGALLVGPNNAGKSTLLTAIRLADTLMRYSHRRNPEGTKRVGDVLVFTYPIQLREYPALRDSLRYEFSPDEARMELTWKSGAKLVAVWPDERGDEEESQAYFYLTQPSGSPVRNPRTAREFFPTLGIIPVLAPIDHSESLLDDRYVRNNISGRLSSRHFRNQLRLLQDDRELDSFLTWSKPWMGDLTFDQLQTQIMEGNAVLTAYAYESQSRIPKELVWAGDGIQVWLQLLYHVYRVRDRAVIVLDEPDVYLHPDLQRRLVRLLESTGSQVVLATHSTELLTEADSRNAVLIDRTRKTAIRPTTEAQHDMLSSMLGTAFNLRLAKALRSKVAVFVEGQDMSVLRHIARRLGLRNMEREEGMTVIPLNGYSGWKNVEPFQWLTSEILPDVIKTFVILDRDYRPNRQCADVLASFTKIGVDAHIWEKKELESYLITSSVISRLSGMPEPEITGLIDELTMSMGDAVFAKQLEERLNLEVKSDRHQVNVVTDFKAEFDAAWTNRVFRLAHCPPKQMLSLINQRLQDQKYKSVSVAGLARNHRISEIDPEMKSTLMRIDTAVGAAD